MFSGVAGLRPPHAKSISPPPCDNQECLQTLPVFLGGVCVCVCVKIALCQEFLRLYIRQGSKDLMGSISRRGKILLSGSFQTKNPTRSRAGQWAAEEGSPSRSTSWICGALEKLVENLKEEAIEWETETVFSLLQTPCPHLSL